jgi:competence protein ComEA
VRLPTRRSDDADVIRARLRALLADSNRPVGWLPDDDDPPPEAAPDTSTEDGETGQERLPAGMGRHRAPGTATRWDPGRPGARALWVAGILAGLLLVAWTWLDRPSVEPARDPQPPAVGDPAGPPSSPAVEGAADVAPTVVVSVVGLVARPGLVTLPTGSRVADAVAAAGGLLADADPSTVNLAALVADGEQIAVGAAGAAPAGSASGSGSAAGPVNLNTATIADLDGLPGIGPVLAERIVDHRTAQGRFTSVDELNDVPGIGPAIYAGLADLVTV